MNQLEPIESNIVAIEQRESAPRVTLNVVDELKGPVPTWRIDYLSEGSHNPVGVVFLNDGTTVTLALSESLDAEQALECWRAVVYDFFGASTVRSTRISSRPACVVYILHPSEYRRVLPRCLRGK